VISLPRNLGFASPPELSERRERRRVQLIWGGLFLHSWTWIDLRVPILIPQRAWQLIALLSLLTAFFTALVTNRQLLVRPNLFLILLTGLWLITFIPIIRLQVPFGSYYRVFKLSLYVMTLWLTTPWWGRRDMLILRCHLRCAVVACGIVFTGLVLFPTGALGGYEAGRLVGVFPTLPPPQVGQLCTIAAGLLLLGWNAGYVKRSTALRFIAVCVVMLLLSRTRTALLGLFIGGGLAMLTLITTQSLVRRRIQRTVLALPLIVLALIPIAPAFLTRGQDAQQITQLTGRTKVWVSLVAYFRTGIQQFFGVGLTDKSWEGLSIDSAWFSIYHEQGWVGLALGGGIMLGLLAKIVLAEPGLPRAVATFVLTYCLIAFVTEVGLGDTSFYLLHIAMAFSVLMPRRPDDDTIDPRDAIRLVRERTLDLGSSPDVAGASSAQGDSAQPTEGRSDAPQWVSA
jgi:hypothetical protein